MKTKRLLYIVLSVLILASMIACGTPSQEENPAEENAFSEASIPVPEWVPDYFDSEDLCGSDLWVNQRTENSQNFNPELVGVEIRKTFVSETIDGRSAQQTWLIEVEQININDRIVYLPSFGVVQRIQVNGDEKLVNEINPEPWVTEARKITNIAKPIVVFISYHWKSRYPDDPDYSEYYDWIRIDENVSCSIK